MTGPTRPGPVNPTQLRIGLWGPPGSGKTTFLAALKIATMRHGVDTPSWIMHGSDDAATRFLQDTTYALTTAKTFPVATTNADSMVFRFTGERRSASRKWYGKKVPESHTIAFDLDVLDVPGGTYGRSGTAPATTDDEDDGFTLGNEPTGFEPRGNDPDEMEDRLLDHLQDCHGIVYLFDPERDAHEGDAFRYFHPVLEKLTRRVMEQDHGKPKLPHHVAVCVTKFDKPDIYKKARVRGYTVFDNERPYLPRVDNERAGDFFRMLCEDPQTNTDMVERGLRQYFSTLNYFVTSSIGFYVADNRFRSHDCLNVERVGPEHTDFKIKGRVYPINVLEPLLWLYNSLTKAE
ncbi:hypothetical protein [Actinokineospora fastidiosa]|uniref:Uncharacterized protein n=1 Tax=Actinokineospora fastidiosa TaxID=1816 RepID=A0A918GRC2_9PSEU|nr:hypothetical protein [Actinokineospora fastidiosa]GGS54795.1 hypothetical protein GCM10010171_57430 [Actinokineospora fastidiosa]